MNSIFHFFKEIYLKRNDFTLPNTLENFTFPQNLLSCINRGTFPDMAIKLNKNQKMFSGGELIELKDNDKYTVSSFNSTIPSGTKNIQSIIGNGKSSTIKKKMESAGDDVLSLQEREVYYLVRGRKSSAVKVVLVHGSFFKTIKVSSLIGKSFLQVLEERIQECNADIPDNIKKTLSRIMTDQESFNRQRTVPRASVKLRFRIMVETNPKADILNSDLYPRIRDNTLSIILPKHSYRDLRLIKNKMKEVFSGKELKTFKAFDIKHHFNGYFRVYQTVIE